MIRKRHFVISILLITISLIAFGCSSTKSGENNSKDKKSQDNQDGITTVSFWHPMGDGPTADAIDAVIEEFESQNPDIKIDATVTPESDGNNEKLLTAIAGGNAPDVAYFGRFEIASWAIQDSFEDLTEMAERDGVNKDDFYPSAWDEAVYDGKLYGVPTTTDSRLMFYNKDHFEEVGLDPDNPPTSIDELEEAAEKLTIKDGNRFERIGFIPWYGQGWFYGWGWSFGGDFYNAETGEVTANHPANIEALEWMVDFGQRYGVEDIAGFTDSQGTEAMDPFLSGQLSMKVDGNWAVAAIDKFNPDLNYGVFPIPTPSGTDHTTWSGGWSVVMPKGVKEQEAGWEFMKFFGSEEGLNIFSELSRDYSARESVNYDLGYDEHPIFKEFIDILPMAHTRPVMTKGTLYWNELITAVENATRGIGTPEEVLNDVNEKLTKELSKDE